VIWTQQLTIDVVGLAALYGRLAGFFFGLPLYSSSLLPVPWRAALPLAVSVLLAPALPPDWGRVVGMATHSVPGLALLMLRELALGLTAALFVRLLQEIWFLAGDLIGMEMGLSFAQQIDPNLEQESNLISTFFGHLFILLLLATGMHLDLLRLVVQSVERMPPGGFVPDVALADAVGAGAARLFSEALRLALPVFVAIGLVQLGMAMVARFCQDFEVLMLAFPVQIGVGLLVLALSVPALVGANRGLAQEVVEMVGAVLGS
jgi:flagellar biosynthetic protein FliR